MRTVFYLSEKEVSKAIQEYVLNTLHYYGNEKSREITMTVEDVCTIPNDDYAACVLIKIEKE